MRDAAVGPRLGQGGDGDLERCLGVDPMQLEEVDALGAQLEQRLLDLPEQGVAPAVDDDAVCCRLLDPALGRPDHRQPVERLTDEPIGRLWPVGPGAVEEIDAERGSAAQQSHAARPIEERSEITGPAAQAHGAITQSVDLEIAADAEGSLGRLVSLRALFLLVSGEATEKGAPPVLDGFGRQLYAMHMSRPLDRLTLLETFARIADRGSISAAARDSACRKPRPAGSSRSWKAGSVPSSLGARPTH